MPVRHHCDADPPVWNPPQKQNNIELKLSTITPLFGGGYETRKVDPECVIRPAAIRGQLRFWWRATAGAHYATAKELFEAEEKLWGSAERRGAVAIKVKVDETGEEKKCAEFERRRDGSLMSLPRLRDNWPPYALQPFQGKAERGQVTLEPSIARTGVKFSVTLSNGNAEQQDIVSQAAIAWAMFGGVGARTRRGCGSLTGDNLGKLDMVSPAGNAPGQLTHLCGASAVWGPITSDPIIAWKMAVEVYRDFRQKPGYARNPGEGQRPGRSRWPEPDSIRRIARTSAPGHAPAHSVEGFPRADLGLPIIFHFQGERDGDPKDHTLQGADSTALRFASPVITKAIAVGPGKYRPLLLILNSPHVWEMGDLDLNGSRITRARNDLDAAARNKVCPLQGLPIREALVKFALDYDDWEKAGILR